MNKRLTTESVKSYTSKISTHAIVNWTLISMSYQLSDRKNNPCFIAVKLSFRTHNTHQPECALQSNDLILALYKVVM